MHRRRSSHLSLKKTKGDNPIHFARRLKMRLDPADPIRFARRLKCKRPRTVTQTAAPWLDQPSAWNNLNMYNCAVTERCRNFPCLENAYTSKSFCSKSNRIKHRQVPQHLPWCRSSLVICQQAPVRSNRTSANVLHPNQQVVARTSYHEHHRAPEARPKQE